MANEKRLIDANALIDELIKKQYSAESMGILHTEYPNMRAIVVNQPTVDAVEVVHGRWAVSRESEISKDVWCTACGEGFYLHKKNTVRIDKMPYCPNCGAYMRGEGNG